MIFLNGEKTCIVKSVLSFHTSEILVVKQIWSLVEIHANITFVNDKEFPSFIQIFLILNSNFEKNFNIC